MSSSFDEFPSRRVVVLSSHSRTALQGWQSAHAIVILDGVTVGNDRGQIFRLSLMQGRRAIPLVWRVLPTEGLAQVEILEGMRRCAAVMSNRAAGRNRLREYTCRMDFDETLQAFAMKIRWL